MEAMMFVLVQTPKSDPQRAECAACEEEFPLDGAIDAALAHVAKSPTHVVEIDVTVTHLVVGGVDVHAIRTPEADRKFKGVEAIDVILALLNSYKGDNLWEDVVARFPLRDDDRKRVANGGQPLSFHLADGTVVAYDESVGLWRAEPEGDR